MPLNPLEALQTTEYLDDERDTKPPSALSPNDADAKYLTKTDALGLLSKIDAGALYVTPAVIPAAVAAALSDNEIIKEAAANAASDAVTAELIEKSVAPAQSLTANEFQVAFGETPDDPFFRIAELPASTGYIFAIQSEDSKLLSGIKLDGTVDVFLSSDTLHQIATAIGTGDQLFGVFLPDAIHEWWAQDLVIWDGKKNRLLFGGIGKDGSILACEYIPGLRARAIKVGQTEPDDHNTPTPILLSDGSVALTWTRHNMDNFVHIAWGNADGSIESLADNPIVLADIGDRASYTQLTRIKHLSDTTKDVIWSLTRKNNTSWGHLPLTFNFASRVINIGAYNRIFSSPDGRQAYVSVEDANAIGDQILRYAWCYNPAQPVHDLYYAESNVVTGAIKVGNNPTFSANLNGTNLPIVDTTVTPTIAPVPTGWSRRLHYVGAGPINPGIIYSQGPETDPDGWHYYEAFLIDYNANTWDIVDLGPCGPRVGYTSAANYLGGCGYPSIRVDRTVAVARKVGTLSTIEVSRISRGVRTFKTIAQSTEHRLIRPFSAGPLGWLYCDVESYSPVNYEEYNSSLRSAQEGR